MTNYLKIAVVTLGCFACKKQVSETSKHVDSSPQGIYLEFTTQGLQIKIADKVPQQKFYRLHLKEFDFSPKQIVEEMTGSEGIVFKEVIFAFQTGNQTFTCQLNDVAGKSTFIEAKKHCHVQPKTEDYFRQFVDWCEEGAAGKKSPWSGHWQSNLQCKRFSYKNIPAFCFTGNANACFSSLTDDTRAGPSQITKYLQANPDQKFVDILRTIDAEMSFCHSQVVLGNDLDKTLYCKCGSSRQRIINGTTRLCRPDPSSNAVSGFLYHYHFLDSYYLSPTGSHPQ